MGERVPKRFRCPCIPDARGVVSRDGDHAQTVRAELRRLNPVLKPQLNEELSGLGIPDLRSVVAGRRNYSRPVGAEFCGVNSTLMPERSCTADFGRRIPELCAPARSGDDPQSIRTELTKPDRK